MHLATFFISNIRGIFKMLLAVSGISINIKAMWHRTLFAFFFTPAVICKQRLTKFYKNSWKETTCAVFKKLSNFKLFLMFNFCLILTKVAKLHFSASALTKNRSNWYPCDHPVRNNGSLKFYKTLFFIDIFGVK